MFGSAQTIALTSGTLSIPAYTTITGPTTGSGATLTNLVTIDGGGSTSNFSVFTVTKGVTGAALANLTIANGHTTSEGGGLNDNGSVSIMNCAFANNEALGYASGGDGNGGGAIFVNENAGTLTIVGSTFTGNKAAPGGAMTISAGNVTISNSTFYGNAILTNVQGGGAIFVGDNGPPTVTITNSTFSGNIAASGEFGGLLNYGTLQVSNSIFAGDTGGECTGSGCPSNGANGNIVNAAGTAVNLAALANYGGPTQTMIPLPGSSAICAGSAAAAATAGIASDQRGEALTLTTSNAGTYTGAGGYCPAGSMDAGAVQSDYAMKFVQQPRTVVQNATMTPAPTVELDESGAAFFDGADTISIPLTLTTGSGTLTGGSASTSATTGIATYSGLSVSQPGTGDQLTATLSLNPALATPLSLTQTSSTFNVNSAVAQLAFSTAPSLTVTAGGNAGSAIVVHEEDVNAALVTTASDTITLTVTGPNSYSKAYTQTAVNGVATFNLSSAALTAAGGYSYVASIASSPSVTNAMASATVNAAAAYTVSVVSGSGQSAVIGGAFAQPLKVMVEDQYTNPVSGAAVNFTAPASGASASFSTPAATAADGTTSVTATANGTASSTAYTVTASVGGATTSASFQLTNTEDTTSLTVTPGAASIVYGQPETITAAITPNSIAGSAPSGSVTFYDGTTPLTPASSVTSAMASYTVSVPTVATHHYYAQYSGDTNFKQSAETAATSAVVVSQATSTLQGPASTVSLTYGVGGTIPIMVAGEYSGAGIATPSGTVSYAIGSGTPQTATITAGAATLAIPVTQAAGNYTVTVSYSGDGNYQAATSIPVSLAIGQAATTTTLGVSAGTGSPALSLNVTPGQSVTLTATVTSTAGTPGGTVSFYDNGTLLNATPVTLSGGVATYSTSTLAPGITHALTATYNGSVDYATSSNTSSATVSVAPLDFTLNLSGLAAQTVIPGQSVSFTFTVSPDYGSYAGAVNFTATGLPAGATATFSPSSIAANGGPQTVTVTIQTAPTTAMEHAPSPPGSSGKGAAPFALAGLLLLGIGTLRRRGRAVRNLLCIAVLLVSSAAAMLLSGCGGTTGYFAQAPQNYTITLTATAGGLTHSGNVTLNVQ